MNLDDIWGPTPPTDDRCPECGYPKSAHHWSCRSKNTYTPPTPPRSPECPCGIDRRDCEYHR